MKRSFILLLILLLGITIFGCNLNTPNDEPEVPHQNSEPGITGYIMDKAGDRILVVNTEPKYYSSNEHYDAVWFSNAPQNVDIGDMVNVWYDFMEDSYPGQSQVKHLEKLPSFQPEGANLSESQALYNALTSSEIKGAAVVTSLEYDNNSNKWHIELKDTMSNEKFDIKVDD